MGKICPNPFSRPGQSSRGFGTAYDMISKYKIYQQVCVCNLFPNFCLFRRRKTTFKNDVAVLLYIASNIAFYGWPPIPGVKFKFQKS